MNKKAKAILDFWFIKTSPEEKFNRNDEFDKKIKDLFLEDYKKATNNEYDYWQESAEECLALIILLDQFSRNLFRNDPKAFAMDYKTQIIVKNAISKNYHTTLPNNYILFIFLPLMHSEKLEDQLQCNKLIDEYLKDNKNYKEINKFAKIHLDIIKKFGRFPYRNKVLKRKNTKDENNYLSSTHHGFFNI